MKSKLQTSAPHQTKATSPFQRGIEGVHHPRKNQKIKKSKNQKIKKSKNQKIKKSKNQKIKKSNKVKTPYKRILQFARSNRKNQTPAEKKFWKKVRNRRFQGLKFLRQYPIAHSEIQGKKYYFIPDFYCHEKRLIVEIDGGIHEQQIEYDKQREEILKGMKYHIIRFKNEEVLNGWDTLEKKLESYIQKLG